MLVLVSGSNGLVGSRLVPALREAGHEVKRIVRREARRPDEVRVELAARSADAAALEGAGAVVHLAGYPIAAGRWNRERKRRIEASRVEGSRFLAETLAGLERRPRVLVCASAVGVYGSRGDDVLTEGSPPGEGFLAEVCKGWEAACDPARAAGIRVAHLRFGIVLSGEGGALQKMLPPFRLGLGGPIGSGAQWWSWITRDDAVGAIRHVLESEGVEGPLNAVSPAPARCRDFARALGRVLGRPAVLPLPAPAARLLFGEMADEMLLASQRVEPQGLVASGFAFADPELEPALRRVLGR